MYLDDIETDDGYNISCTQYTQLGVGIAFNYYVEIEISGKGLYFMVNVPSADATKVKRIRDNMIKMHDGGMSWEDIKNYYEL